jgi:hypothetical protein
MNSNEINTIESLTLEANRFFDDFVTAFSTFSGEVVARLFSHPYMAVDSDGNPTILESPAHTAQYFQKYLEDYKGRGSKSCRYDYLDVVPIGSSGALFSVTWSLQDSSGETINSWSESYCVSRTIEGMLAYASIDHAA